MDGDNFKADLLTEPYISNPIIGQEMIVQQESPLTLTLDDTDFWETSDRWSQSYKVFYSSQYNLFERRKKNEMYLFGQQLTEQEKNNELKEYEPRYGDNALWEIESTIKPLAVQSIPDLIITPPSEQADPQVSEELTKIVDSQNKSEEIRTLMGLATKHLPIYFTAVIKCRWNPAIDDYEFYIVHPNDIEADEVCRSNDADKMKKITEYLSLTVQEAFMRFPQKKQELLKRLRADGLVLGEEEPKTKDLQSTFKIKEIWCDWPMKKTITKEDGTTETGWEIVSMVAWKYKDVVLLKMRNPNFDWEGEEKLFTYDDPSDANTKRELTEEELLSAVAMGVMPPNLSKERVYHNYFSNPRKPYYFFGYDQYHKQPYDETSRIEQNLRNQENLDSLGKQIIQTLRNRVKHIFSKDGGLKAEDLEKMDLEDPTQHILIEGEVGKTHGIVSPERPDSAEFAALDQQRQRMYGMAGAAAVRGQIQSDVATTNQIAREGDFSRADDLVADTVNPACQWIAEWSLQMIKLRYTSEKMFKLFGDKGALVYLKLNRDKVSDGMEVMIKASSTDKLKAAKEANDMAAISYIDPFNYYKDTGKDDPEGRTEDLILFQNDPPSYLAKIKGLGSTPQQLVDSMNGPGASEQLMAQDQAVPEAPQNPTPTDTAQVPALPPQGPPEGSVRTL